jgi:predicted nucleic acid-binding protein
LKIFVDTSAWIALADKRDVNHSAAAAIYNRVRDRAELLTSNFVFDETLTWIRYRLSHSLAVSVGENMRQSRLLTIVRVDAEVETAGWQIFKEYADQKFSFTDCTSFALMRKHRVRKAFAFDSDFTTMRFQLVLASRPK